MNSELLHHLRPDQLPSLIPAFLAERLEGLTAEQVEAMLIDWTPEDYTSLHAHLLALGKTYTIYSAHPGCRKLARDFMRVVFPEISVSGVNFLRSSMADGPTVIVTNHLSYIDALATDLALAASDSIDLADKIVYLAGPKVYEEMFRLMAAASIHNLPVPQSTRLEHTEPLPPRELARRVRSTLDASYAALDEGRAVLLYPEGSRARDGRLAPFFQATRRYVSKARFVVPAAITGTDTAMPLHTKVLKPSSLQMSFAPPIPLDGKTARDVLEAAHRAIESLLPEHRRPPLDSDRLC